MILLATLQQFGIFSSLSLAIHFGALVPERTPSLLPYMFRFQFLCCGPENSLPLCLCLLVLCEILSRYGCGLVSHLVSHFVSHFVYHSVSYCSVRSCHDMDTALSSFLFPTLSPTGSPTLSICHDMDAALSPFLFPTLSPTLSPSALRDLFTTWMRPCLPSCLPLCLSLRLRVLWPYNIAHSGGHTHNTGQTINRNQRNLGT